LTWFFLVIVIVPMVAVAVVLFRLVADSERGKSDARLGQAQQSAQAIFEDASKDSAAVGRKIAQDKLLATALDDGAKVKIQAALDQLTRREASAQALMKLKLSGATYTSGTGRGVAPATTALVTAKGGVVGTLEVAKTTATDLAKKVLAHTTLDTVITGPGGTLATTVPGLSGDKLPLRGEAQVSSHKYRLTAFTAPAFEGDRERVTVRLLSDEADTQSAITQDSFLVAGLLLAFLVLAFAFAYTVSRSLQAQIARLLEAAKRLGSGEFAVEVPTDGNDEFAALGSEFNAMARQLEARLADLQTERSRLQHAIRRVGESFAKGLDRDALLDVVVQTAVDGVDALAGRATVREYVGGPLQEAARAGDVEGFKRALHAAEVAVLEAGEPAETVVAGAIALAHPLKASDDSETVVGIISIVREGDFAIPERELFSYLARQAAVSIENVDLHETVQRQAVTDELTGLFNHRHFQEVMSMEVERARRFKLSLGLIMLDLDNFKSINDTYGHLQGDLVLREVARILRETCREIDDPARYGGEEMAVALPETDLEGAVQFAERLRLRIEELEVPILDGDGDGNGDGPAKLRVTASFGAAALPESSDPDKDALVAAADAALYRAKRMGKNRVIKAG
jgi:diguanylate cyclase (GGDEF)-like protein